MGEVTGIAWTDHTQNFWIGCSKVSPACDFCYAESLMDHRHHRVEWGGARVRTSAANWKKPYQWDRAAQKAGVRRRVFTLSLGDFFDNQVDPTWRQDAWETIENCPHLDWLILTKRPQNIAKMLPTRRDDPVWQPKPWPWPHVWFGTTAENQEEWDRRLRHLARIPAVVHFVSVEPMLERIDCGNAFDDPGDGSPYAPIRWVICGGESGVNARPFDIGWARDLHQQCQIGAGAAFFMKQLGHQPIGTFPGVVTGKGDDPLQWPEDLRVREFPVPAEPSAPERAA